MVISNNGVGIGTSTPNQALTIEGSISASGDLYLDEGIFDINNSKGSSGQILSSTGTGVDWINQCVGTVTSVVASTTTINGLKLSGGTITSTGTIALDGILGINNNDWTAGAELSVVNGGTGASTASAARSNLGAVSGVGASNRVSKWTGSDDLTCANIWDTGTQVGIGATPGGSGELHVDAGGTGNNFLEVANACGEATTSTTGKNFKGWLGIHLNSSVGSPTFTGGDYFIAVYQ
jgi:hypothetical protein